MKESTTNEIEQLRKEMMEMRISNTPKEGVNPWPPKPVPPAPNSDKEEEFELFSKATYEISESISRRDNY